MDASLDPIHMPERAVAIIGSGPAGLVAARFLKKHGFDPVVFEAAAAVGGQWNIASPVSAVWPGMRTNTSRVLTAFSDLDPPLGTNVYPSHVDMLAYLQRYAETVGLTPHLRLSTPVERLDRGPGAGWIVRSRRGESTVSELFSRVVVATGCCTTPDMPAIAGLSSFADRGGAIHSSQYGGAAGHQTETVLVGRAFRAAPTLCFANAPCRRADGSRCFHPFRSASRTGAAAGSDRGGDETNGPRE